MVKKHVLHIRGAHHTENRSPCRSSSPVSSTLLSHASPAHAPCLRQELRTPVQQPVQDLATSGSPGRSMAVTWNVGAGQNLPPRPRTTHSCTQIWSSTTCGKAAGSPNPCLGCQAGACPAKTCMSHAMAVTRNWGASPQAVFAKHPTHSYMQV